MKDKIKICSYRIKIDDIVLYYPKKTDDDLYGIHVEIENKTNLLFTFNTEKERDETLYNLDTILTINPMNLRKEKLEEINKN